MILIVCFYSHGNSHPLIFWDNLKTEEIAACQYVGSLE